jgi:hypothetical protein
MSLCLDTPKSGPATRKQVFAKNLIPEATRTYQPLPNKIMIDMIYRIAEENKLKLTNEQLGLDHKGNRMFGVCDIEGRDFLGGDIKMMIGFCNSYDGTMTARFCIGGKVFVCSNMAFHAYTDEKTGISGIAKRPHKNLNNLGIRDGLVQQIRAAFDQIEDFREAQESFYGGLLNRRLNDDKAYSTIVRAAQQGIINKTKVLTLANEWDRQAMEPNTEPDYEWHSEFKGRNAYSLFNAFTQVEKDRLSRNPVASNISTIDLSGFFAQEFALN